MIKFRRKLRTRLRYWEEQVVLRTASRSDIDLWAIEEFAHGTVSFYHIEEQIIDEVIGQPMVSQKHILQSVRLWESNMFMIVYQHLTIIPQLYDRMYHNETWEQIAEEMGR